MESDKLYAVPSAATSYGSTTVSTTAREGPRDVDNHSVAFLDVNYAVAQGVRIFGKPTRVILNSVRLVLIHFYAEAGASLLSERSAEGVLKLLQQLLQP